MIAITIGGIQAGRGSSSSPGTANHTSTALAQVATSSQESAKSVAPLLAPANHLVFTTQSLPQSLSTIIAKTSSRTSLSSAHRANAAESTGVSHSVMSAVTSAPITGSCSSNCHSTRSWMDKLNLSLGEYIPKDLIIRPVDTLGFVARKCSSYQRPPRSRPNTKPSGPPVKSLSFRSVQNSLAVVSSKCKVVKEKAGKDISVLFEAIDELLHTLSRQIDSAKDEIKNAKDVAQSSFSLRNARAKGNAQRIRRAGEHLIQAAGNHLRSKGEEAVNVARKVCDRVKEFTKVD